MRCLGIVAVAALFVAAIVGCSRDNSADALAQQACRSAFAGTATQPSVKVPAAPATPSLSELVPTAHAADTAASTAADTLAAAAKRDDHYREASLAMSRYASAWHTLAGAVDRSAAQPNNPVLHDALGDALSDAQQADSDARAECRIIEAS